MPVKLVNLPEDLVRKGHLVGYWNDPPQRCYDVDNVYQPPKYHYGWALDDSHIHTLIKMSEELGVLCLYTPGTREMGEAEAIFLPDGRKVNFVVTVGMVCECLLKRANLRNLVTRDILQYVVKTGKKLAVTIYDNYHIPKKPLDQSIEAIRKLFGFDELPEWLPDVDEKEWIVSPRTKIF